MSEAYLPFIWCNRCGRPTRHAPDGTRILVDRLFSLRKFTCQQCGQERGYGSEIHVAPAVKEEASQ